MKFLMAVSYTEGSPFSCCEEFEEDVTSVTVCEL